MDEYEVIWSIESIYDAADIGIYYRNFLILKKLFNPSIIFYVVDASEEKVYILRILRHERDWQTMLKETIHYSF